MATFPIAKSDLIEGMAKGMAVLESFDTERQRLNATLAAQRTGLTRAAARRHLLTLAHLGYLETDGSYFWLAPKVLRFSGSYLASARLPRVLQPTLNRLAAQTQQSFSAVVLDGDEVVIVARSGVYGAPSRSGVLSAPSRSGVLSAPSRTMAYGLHLGVRLPAHPTSTGRVLLAALPAAEFTQWLKGCTLQRLTPHTLTQVGALRKVVAQVRRDDFCLAVEEHELGVHALAVPLRNLQGQTVAALNVVASPQQMQAQTLQRDMLPLLQEAARELRGLL